MFYCMAKLWMSRVPTTPFISGSGGVLVHHRPADSEVTGLERKSTVRCNTREAHSLLWELGIGHFWPGALMSANNHRAQLTLTYFQLTTGSK